MSSITVEEARLHRESVTSPDITAARKVLRQALDNYRQCANASIENIEKILICRRTRHRLISQRYKIGLMISKQKWVLDAHQDIEILIARRSRIATRIRELQRRLVGDLEDEKEVLRVQFWRVFARYRLAKLHLIAAQRATLSIEGTPIAFAALNEAENTIAGVLIRLESHCRRLEPDVAESERRESYESAQLFR